MGNREKNGDRNLNLLETVEECIGKYSNQKGIFNGTVVLIRPFAAMSASGYSTPLVLPIGIAYLASVLEASSYPVEIIDALGENINQIIRSDCGKVLFQGLKMQELILRIPNDACIIGVSMMFSQEWPFYRELVNQIRNHYPNATIVAGGEHVTALAEFVLRDCPAIDYAVSGEGELTFLKLVHSISIKRPKNDILINGVSYLDNNGAYIFNGLSVRIEKIERLPRPAWHLLPVENYFIDNFTMGISMGRNMPILATRGCPYRCAFCSSPSMWTTRYTMREPWDVVDEIQELEKRYNVNSIDFFDLTAIVKRNWILDFCNEMIKRKVDVAWQLPSGTRSEALDREVLEVMHQAGCKYLVYAPESGSKKTLELISKKIDLDHFLVSIKQAIKIGHVVKVNFIIGFPEETLCQALQTVLYVFRMASIGVADCNLAIFSPYPGSRLFSELRAKRVIPELNDLYFHNLMSQFDLIASKSFASKISNSMLVFLKNFAQFGFYFVSYLIRPSKIYFFIRALLKKDTPASNLFEQRIHDYFARSAVQKRWGHE